MKAARLSWFERQLDLDPYKLVFLDETVTNTKMARRYGRAPRGERCRVSVPFGRWKTITVTAGLRTSGPMATALFDEGMTCLRFCDYAEQTLAPPSGPVTRSCSTICLPTKLKAILRAAAARRISDFWDTIQRAFRRFTSAECRRYLGAVGYDAYDPTCLDAALGVSLCVG